MSGTPKDFDLDRLRERLRPTGQEHLLRFWSELDGAGRRRLARQIEAVDFDLVAAIFGEMSVISRIVYVLVGVSALAQIVPLVKGDPRQG